MNCMVVTLTLTLKINNHIAKIYIIIVFMIVVDGIRLLSWVTFHFFSWLN